MLFWAYAYHVTWRIFYMSQIYGWTFNQNFCFVRYNFDFFKKWSHYDNNDECTIFEDVQHSQPHMILYQEVVFLSWGGRILRKVESMTMILLSASIYDLNPTSYGVLNMILWTYLTVTCNNNFGTSFFRYHQWRRKDYNLLLEIAQPEGGVKFNFKFLLWPVD